jgi:alpha-1,2-mannosyltransferase
MTLTLAMKPVLQEALRKGNWLTIERARTYPAMLLVITFGALVFTWVTGPTALTDRLGRPIGTDFSSFWTAGRLLLSGDVTGMYHTSVHFAAQRAFFDNPNIDVYGWFYPPFFLGVAALLATMPYLPALFIWQASTLAMFAAVVRAIAPSQPLVVLMALAFPASLITLGHGQNAFLSAALLGGGFLALQHRPVLAGVLFGLLAYKPQLATVLPLVLLLGGHWRATIAAGATVGAMISIATLVLGVDVWAAFFQASVIARSEALELGSEGWFKIQSAFSAVRSFGGSVALAYGVQTLMSGAVLVALSALVIMRADQRLIASAACTASLLTTPFAHDYDMTIAGVAIAFNVAHGAEKGFAPYEKTLLAIVWLTPLFARSGMAVTGFPVGLIVLGAFFVFLARLSLRNYQPANWAFLPLLKKRMFGV